MHFAIKPRSDHDSWLVRWFENGTKRRKNFPSQSAAAQWVRDQRILIETGASPIEVTAATRAAAGTGFVLETLVKAGLESMRGIGANRADLTITFQQASERIIGRATKAGGRQKSIDGYRRVFAVLNRALGPRVAAALTEPEIEEYLSTLKDRTGTGPASAATKIGRLGHIRMVMGVAGIKDPLPGIQLPEDESDVEFFTIDEVKKLLAAVPVKARGFVAVALFACIRPENLELIPEDCVSVENKRIRIPKGIAKDRNGHLLEDKIPLVLWDWLKLYPYKQMTWAPLQRRLKRAVGRWIHDGVRHTGATYYCAVHGVAATAQLLTHESEKLIRRNYAGMVQSTETARQFLGLKPSKIKFRDEVKAVVWPSDDELAKMLETETAVSVAQGLGISDSALAKHCRTRGIRKPGRGHWTKLQHA